MLGLAALAVVGFLSTTVFRADALRQVLDLGIMTADRTALGNDPTGGLGDALAVGGINGGTIDDNIVSAP